VNPLFSRISTIFLAASLTFAQGAQADLFTGFYTSSAPKPKVAQSQRIPSVTTGARCLSAILTAQERHAIPDNLLLAIGIQEAGRNGPEGLAVWPWTANAAGEGVFFNNRIEAEAWVTKKLAEGVKSIDVGCMQVNLHWHGENFPSLSLAFDPERNVDYAARFLRNLYRETGDWTEAAGRYHSATEKHQKRYLASLTRNQEVVDSQMPRLTALANSFNRPIQVAEATEPKAPPPPVFWASAAASGPNYSIYTTQPLQPVLPAFRNSP
jgi:hypothetical protein